MNPGDMEKWIEIGEDYLTSLEYWAEQDSSFCPNNHYAHEHCDCSWVNSDKSCCYCGKKINRD